MLLEAYIDVRRNMSQGDTLHLFRGLTAGASSLGSGSSTAGVSSHLGRTIRDARKARGWSQLTLARVIGVTPTTISRWECGQTCPQFFRLATLSATLQVPNFGDLVRRQRRDRRPPARVLAVAARIARVMRSLTAHIPARRRGGRMPA